METQSHQPLSDRMFVLWKASRPNHLEHGFFYIDSARKSIASFVTQNNLDEDLSAEEALAIMMDQKPKQP